MQRLDDSSSCRRNRASGGFECRVLKHRHRAIRKNGLQFAATSTFRGQPRRDVFRLEIDDAAVVAGGSHIGRRFIGDGREAAKIRLFRIRPV